MRAAIYMADIPGATQLAIDAALDAGATGATLTAGTGWWRDDSGAVIDEPCVVLTLIGDMAGVHARVAARAFLASAQDESAVLLETFSDRHRSELIRRDA